MAPVLYRYLVKVMSHIQGKPFTYTLLEHVLSCFSEFLKSKSKPPVVILLENYMAKKSERLDCNFIWKCLMLGQDRLGWRSVELIYQRVFETMLRPDCQQQSAYEKIFNYILDTFILQPNDIKRVMESSVDELNYVRSLLHCERRFER